jgi:cholesterol transport system auxiliary component
MQCNSIEKRAMKKTMNRHLALLLFTAALLASCATSSHDSPTVYDFGGLNNVQTPVPALAPISIAEPRVPGWLDSVHMIYRLRYANDQQANSYANSRWAMPPAQLFVERLKSRIAQAGGTVLAVADGALNLPVLRIEMDDFSQIFDKPDHSVAQVSVRASVYKDGKLSAYKFFTKQLATPTADAAGGARSLADASDAIIAEITAWLAAMPTAAKQ